MYKIKSVPQDFTVNEVSTVKNSGQGDYSYFYLEKTGYTTERAVQAICDRLRIPRKRVGYAGSKDKNAVTEQYVSVFGVSSDEYVRQVVLFDAYDLDFDGNVDYIEWVVPHLSNQTYELEIVIVDAEHLDSNRTFVVNIYDYVTRYKLAYVSIPMSSFIQLIVAYLNHCRHEQRRLASIWLYIAGPGPHAGARPGAFRLR